MDPRKITYPPLDTLKPVAEDVWIVDSGPFHAMGMPLPVRMTVMRLSDHTLLLHSPTRLEPSLKSELDILGEIRHIVAPNIAHWTMIAEWQGFYPNATVWGAPGLSSRRQVKRSGLRIDWDLGPMAPMEWGGEIELVVVPGIGGFSEVAFFHLASRTLVLTDLVQNIESEKLPPLLRPAAHLAGVTAPDGRAPAYLRLAVKAKGKPARDAARRLAELEPERVVFAHGDWYAVDGARRLRRSLDWLL